jgi:TRAP-type C4-dicarboxylate transport system substrate-binding protein
MNEPSSRHAMRRRAVASIVALLAAAGVANAQPDAPQLKVSVAVGPAMPLGKAAERWAALLTEGAQGRFVAKLHAGATLAGRDAARELLALNAGAADLAVGSALQWSAQVPALGVFSLPWIAPDDVDLDTLVSDPPLAQALAARLEAAGAVLVAAAPLGHREIATLARSIRGPDDLRGLRLRVAAAPLLHDVLSALGATPRTMPFVDAQAAFAKGGLDGQEGLPTALAAARAGAAGQKHLTQWGGIADAMIFAVRKPVWEAWSEAQREAARRAAKQAIEEAGARAREQAAMRQLSRNGVAIVRITRAGHAAFRDAVRDVAARWRNTVGEDVVSLAEQALARRHGNDTADSAK